MGCLTPLAFFQPTLKLHRYLTDRVVAAWCLFVTSILELVLGMKIRVTGDSIIQNKNNLYFMNHRTRFDWMWIWIYLYHYANLNQLKIILKNELKYLPGFGWACQQASFIFLRILF